jgi:integrase
MPGQTQDVNLKTPTARARLKRKREPYWSTLINGRAALGWQKGRWLLRTYVDGKYQRVCLGRADDGAAAADGDLVLSFEQAEAKARVLLDAPTVAPRRLTVRGAMAGYIERQRAEGKRVDDLIGRVDAWINPTLGNAVVSELTAERLRKWLAMVAAAPARGKTDSTTEEEIRARRASANRVLTMLKAGLNFVYDEGLVSRNDAWGRKLKPFRDVEVARQSYLTVPEATRLINASDPEFRPLVIAALQTGARYSELTRLECSDYNPDSRTIYVRKSKSGKARHIHLTDEGADFFARHCAGRSELMFTRDNGKAWTPSAQARPMLATCRHGKLKQIGFHALRHTWASLSVMAGVPLMIVARNLGHADTRMVEKHYGHLAPSYIAEQIRAGAPRFNVVDRKITPLR